MKLCFISDTHGRHDKVIIPECDVLCHTGDVTGHGYEYEFQVFLTWLAKQPAKHKIVIAGNHDWCCQDYLPSIRQMISDIGNDISYLHEDELIIDGVKFFGTPWQPIFLNWAFNLPETALPEKWDKIPPDTNVLLTHCPPKNILDKCPPFRNYSDHAGSESLKQRVLEIKPKVHAFGHIHGSHGILSLYDNITFVNGSILNEQYQVEYEPIIVNI